MLAKLRIDFAAHRSTAITSYDARQASIIFAMDNPTRDKLLQLFPRQVRKIRLFSAIAGENGDITDPDEAGVTDQAQIFLQIRQMIVGNFPRLLAIMENNYE